MQPQIIPPPSDAPKHLLHLHAHLLTLPVLDPASVQIRRPDPPREGPPIPERLPQGRRRRGGTYAGDGVGEPGDVWSWIVQAQVKEGTEGKGAIQAVLRSSRSVVSLFPLN